MSLTMVFGRDDPARTRFVVSPLWETMAALRVLLEPQPAALPPALAGSGAPRGWSNWTCGRCSRCRRATAGLRTSSARSRPGRAPACRWQLAQVRATPPDQVAHEVRRSLTERGGEPVAARRLAAAG